MRDCQARQYSDEMHCARCRLRWDTNDPEPPPCPFDKVVIATRAHDESIERSKQYVSALAPSYVDNLHKRC